MGVMNSVCYSSMVLEMVGSAKANEDGLVEKMEDAKIKQEGILEAKLNPSSLSFGVLSGLCVTIVERSR
jgi:hypothetical protein